ncbi:ParM/StbA family protein [Alicyclobacillus sp. SO9]|uniref:ParM/StbA family protein n=1 Tax=Alicyclobacillus sp. SO9 TaxID=2665646 RepID=UPI0018E8A67E|nr:ParM/StbA family protein [Alicyclobacillus sp. SO9]QQE81530.1 ParM/StbA family protein [Alicyclobacillus sp. SO9]
MSIRLIAVDSGRSSTKVVTDGARDWFPSILGEYRDLKLERKMQRTDLVVGYAGQRYYVGDVAKDESVSGAQLMISSKAHMDTKIFVLTALHRVLPNKSAVFLVTGEPISNHQAGEKLRMKQLLLGSHEIAVNGETKQFDIVRCEVAAECATAGWAMRRPGRYHIVDCGSRTVNFATMENGRWIDRVSGSLDYGLETVQNISLSMFSRMTVAELSRRLGTLAPIVLIGGKASQLQEYFQQYTSDVEADEDAYYRNAQAFYELGVHALETAKA